MQPGTIILPSNDEFSTASRGRGEWLCFNAPHETLAATATPQIPALLARLEEETRRGRWVAGFLTYEAAAAFDHAYRVNPPLPVVPLGWFGIYDEPRRLAELPVAEGRYRLGCWHPTLGREDYARRIARIRDFIAAGDTYQLNFTFPLRASFEGDPWALFLDLLRAQSSRHAGFIALEGLAIVSASPELFFAQSGDAVLTRPMKGTAPRGRWPEEDERRTAMLRASAKERAENIMIVDLLRNDLGRIARPGSVEVTRLFEIERYPTVLQMTSTIRARTAAGPIETLKALFPCGSITGAPKIRTMELIAELEADPRGIYTGAIGWVGPGRRAWFSVPIRTVQLDLRRGEAVYGAGSGVTWDSTAEGEYEECLVKARLLRERRAAFSLLETMLWEPDGGFFLLERHWARLAASARYFDRWLDEEAVRAALAALAAGFGEKPQRVRLLVDERGAVRLEAHECAPAAPGPVRVGLAPWPVDSADPFLFHKTTQRELYERAKEARPDGDDVLLWNERGEMTESTVANLVVDWGDGILWTPPRHCGLLGGTYREALLEGGKIRERVVRKEDLQRARRLWLINSVRRWVAAELLTDRES